MNRLFKIANILIVIRLKAFLLFFMPSSSGFAIRWFQNIRICDPITNCISYLYIHFTTSTIFSPKAS